MRKFAMLAAMAGLISAPALAQSGGAAGNAANPSTSGAPQAQGPSDEAKQQLELVVRGDKLIGKEVTGSDGKVLGEIKDVISGVDGHLQAAIIETGGFLGMGGRKVAVPMTKMNIEGERIGADLTIEQAADMPEHQEPANSKSR